MALKQSIKVASVSYVLFICLVKTVLCCNGHDLEVISTQNCDKPNIMNVKGNFTATLEDNCDIVVRGCAKLSKRPIKKLMLRFALNKPTLVGTKGKMDVCKLIRKSGGRLKCPIPPKRICLNGELKVSIANYKSLLGLARGKVKLELNGELDKGNICLEMEGNIDKKKPLLIS